MRVLLAVVGSVALLAACQPTLRDGQFTCTTSSDCPVGFACPSGLCVRSLDGGDRDVSLPDDVRVGGDVPILDDVRVGTDADAPSTDTPADGPDSPIVTVENCTPSTALAVPADEDGDGEVDEGCAWNFGQVHLVESVTIGQTVGVAFGPDALEMFAGAYVATIGGWNLVRSVRPSRTEPWGRPGVVAMGVALVFPTLRGDGLEMYAQHVTNGQIFQLMRGSPMATFGGVTDVSATLNEGSADRLAEPFLSEDGLELFYLRGTGSTDWRIWRATRSAVGASWSGITMVNIAGFTSGDVEVGPALTPDGHTLFFQRTSTGGTDWMAAHRDALTSASFDTPVRLSLPAHPLASGIRYVEPTRELYFHAAATRTDAPTTPSMYRVRVCRDSPCPVTPPIACAFGVASPDQRHCFQVSTTPATYDTARTVCSMAGGTLASIRSPDELITLNDVLTVAGLSAAWLGGSTDSGSLRWEDGPFFDFWTFRGGAYAPFVAMEPSMLAPPNGILAGADPSFISWRLASALTTHPYVCETTDWPSW